ncbi:MAG: LacI family DNA-binding transcriptional regulator [Erysipelotrichales bacterium]|nr:LacI family DNA-binding transcriptional regulator [Erysipelotrichales bacterium]
MENLKNRVTIYEVAKVSGVSLATVSRVINNSDIVSKKTKDKVNAVIKKLGYKPSALAQGLATSKSTTIGIVIPSANYVYISNMLSGMTDKAKELGYNLRLFTTSHNREEAVKVMEGVITSHVDGAIIFDDELENEELMQIASYAVPLVAINNDIEASNVGCIHFGYEHNIRNIVNEYLKQPNKEMYFLHSHNAGRLLARIEKAFVETHIQNNANYGILSCNDSYSKTYSDFKVFFESTKKGYFLTYRDSLAAAIMNAAIDSGLRVPEDVEVLSLIGTKYAQILRPQISCMHIDLYSIGAKAVEMLANIMNQTECEKHLKIASEFIKRSTTL